MSPTKISSGIPGWTFERRRDPTFKFLPAPHEYHLKGKRLWSPSMVFEQVRYSNYDKLSQADREEALYRGTYVHHATHLIDDNDPGIWDKIYHGYRGFCEAYAEFKHVYRWKPRLREVPLYHPEELFATTPDGEGEILEGDDAIVEIKTGTMPWWTAIQTAAHDVGISAWDGKTFERRRFGVELKESGKFRAQEFEDSDDYYTWKCALKTARRHYKEPPQKLTEILVFK